jgi:hypothetical protein
VNGLRLQEVGWDGLRLSRIDECLQRPGELRLGAYVIRNETYPMKGEIR